MKRLEQAMPETLAPQGGATPAASDSLHMLKAEDLASLLRCSRRSPHPHIAHALWRELGYGDEILAASWPEPLEAALVQDEIELVLQVNGKLRGAIAVAPTPPAAISKASRSTTKPPVASWKASPPGRSSWCRAGWSTSSAEARRQHALRALRGRRGHIRTAAGPTGAAGMTVRRHRPVSTFSILAAARLAIAAIAATVLLAGCGFAPRGGHPLPFDSLFVTADASSSLGRTLRQQIERGRSPTRIRAEPAGRQRHPEILSNRREKELHQPDQRGQGAQYRLTQTLPLSPARPEGRGAQRRPEISATRGMTWMTTNSSSPRTRRKPCSTAISSATSRTSAAPARNGQEAGLNANGQPAPRATRGPTRQTAGVRSISSTATNRCWWIEAGDTIRTAAKRQRVDEREVLVAGQGFRWSRWRWPPGQPVAVRRQQADRFCIPNGKPGKDGGEALQRFATSLGDGTIGLITLPELDWAARKAAWFSKLSGPA